MSSKQQLNFLCHMYIDDHGQCDKQCDKCKGQEFPIPATVQERIDAEYPMNDGFIDDPNCNGLRKAMQKGYTLAMQTVAAEITKTEDYHPYKVRGQHDTYSNYNQGWSDALGTLESELFKSTFTNTSK